MREPSTVTHAPATGLPTPSRTIPLTVHSENRSTTASTVVVLPATTTPGLLSRGSKKGLDADQRKRNGPAGNSNRYAPSPPVVTLWPVPAPSVTRTCAPESGASGLKVAPKYAARLTMPWTIPVVGARGVTTVEEGTVGASAAPHAVSSDITAQSAHVGATWRTIGESGGNFGKGVLAGGQKMIRGR